MGRRLVLSFLTLLCLLAAGCSHIGYIWQAARGQMSLYNHERKFNEVYADPTVPEKTKASLRLVEDLKKFVEAELDAKATSNYTSFVDIKRPYVTWVFIAAPPYELKERIWCFPIAGCFPYLGFFDESEARQWADRFKKEGFDTHVRGASAYSTLGFLRDPLLSSMISSKEGDMANLIFHETTHSQIYLSAEGSFNESAASFIGEYGERLYLVKKFGESSAQVNQWEAHRQDRRRFGRMLRTFADELKALYQEKAGDSVAKDKAFAGFRQRLSQEKAYGAWAPSFTNNAVVMAHLTYDDDQDVFDEVYKKCGGSLKDSLRFLKRFGEQYNRLKKPGVRLQDTLSKQLKAVPVGSRCVS